MRSRKFANKYFEEKCAVHIFSTHILNMVKPIRQQYSVFQYSEGRCTFVLWSRVQ